MADSKKLALVEEFFFFLSAPEVAPPETVEIAASIDLAEFEFTDDDLRKLRKLCQKLELALVDQFHHHWEAVSVVVEIRDKG